ncbi:MAG: hypothetical protein ACI837_001945 [Crocinitomicaceae bacterium]|jgi:hypothetical protein
MERFSDYSGEHSVFVESTEYFVQMHINPENETDKDDPKVKFLSSISANKDEFSR